MEFYQCWFHFLLAGMLWSSVFAVGDGGDLGSEGTEECRVARGGLVEELTSSLFHCILPSDSNLPHLSTSDGEEHDRNLARTICSNVPSLRGCLSLESDRWARCRNETLRKVFQVSRELVEATLEDVCQEQGEELATILHGLKTHLPNNTTSPQLLRECLIFGSIKLKTIKTSQAAVPSKLWYVFHEIQSFNECLARNIPGVTNFTRLARQRINTILDTMKCLHPEDESIVRCKDIDPGLIDRAGLCPLKTKSELMVPLSLVLERRASSCYVMYDPYSAKLSDASTPQDFREYFKKYCRRQDRVKYCLSETELAAEICLEDSEFRTFQLIRHYLETMLQAGCFEEGRRVATFMHTGHVIKSSANESLPLMACLADAIGKRDKTSNDPTRLYSFYQELPLVRRCLLDKVEGDAMFNTSVNEFIQEVMDNMKCFDPQDKSVIFCKAITSD